MKCYTHPENDGVSTCKECGKGLCPPCTNKYSLPLCDSCGMDIAKFRKNIVYKNIILTLIFGALGLFMTTSGTHHASLASIVGGTYALAAFPWGWSALTKITPKIFLFMPIAGWIFYFMVKGFIATWVGLVAFPWMIFLNVKEWFRIKGLQSAANSLN